ncbi:MAG: Fe2+-dependent dioxygenase [Hyphomonadaceae bacterium]|nr:Fe2+-dependent dioxygenase [Hyphomonadaceae bacterium]
MILEIKQVLSADEVHKLRALAAAARFVDGRASNPAFQLKENLQGDPADSATAEASAIVHDALRRSREFCDFALPKRIAPPLLARYTAGMKYGVHADAALMPAPHGILRADLSCTVFLSDAATYEGGELVLHLGSKAVPLRAQAGSAIVYPSTTLHEVAAVRSGERLVSITFIESMVPEEDERNVLFELGEISALEGGKMHWANRMRLEAVRQNLTRRWSRL